MMAAIFIEPHERYEAAEAYKDRLTSEQIETIIEAPDGALIQLSFGLNTEGTKITIIEEG